jgi:hypothetical protein
MDLISGLNVFTIAVLFLGLIIVLSAVKVVPQGWEYTVERFGRFTGCRLRRGVAPACAGLPVQSVVGVARRIADGSAGRLRRIRNRRAVVSETRRPPR